MRYHERIGFICEEFGKSLIGNGIINSFKDCPLTVSHLRDIREDSYKYKPDIYLIRQSDKRYITLQVLWSQGNKPKEIVGDILNALLTFQIKMGYFIVSNWKDFERVENLLKISYSILQEIYKLEKQKDLPDLKVLLIERSVRKKQMLKFLEKISKYYKWCK